VRIEVVGDVAVSRRIDWLGRTVRMHDLGGTGHLVIESGHQNVPSVLGAQRLLAKVGSWGS
jgi:hypothetical protein